MKSVYFLGVVFTFNSLHDEAGVYEFVKKQIRLLLQSTHLLAKLFHQLGIRRVHLGWLCKEDTAQLILDPLGKRFDLNFEVVYVELDSLEHRQRLL